MIVDLDKFKRSSSFYNLDLMVTVKSFELKAIRDRYLKSKKRTGSTEKRKTSQGGVFGLSLRNGEVRNQQLKVKLKEPRGIDASGSLVAISSDKEVFIYKSGELFRRLYNPWFSYIHSVQFNSGLEDTKILISSSGFDAIFEYTVDDLRKTYEWFAWENGFDRGVDPETGELVYVTRDVEKAYELEKLGEPFIFISDPRSQTLPTAKRTAFINTVSYGTNSILATMFHDGMVYALNKGPVIQGLNGPHGGRELDNGSIMVTDTKNGGVVLGSTYFDFSNLSGNVMGNKEWIQNSIKVDNVIIAIDSNRNNFTIFDIQEGLIDFVPYNENWAIQDLISV